MCHNPNAFALLMQHSRLDAGIANMLEYLSLMSNDHTPVPLTENPSTIQKMFGDYYLEYASYVILERAVPHIADGLKPVQDRKSVV